MKIHRSQKFIHLKIQSRDGVESLTTLEEGGFKVPIDGCTSVTFLLLAKNSNLFIDLPHFYMLLENHLNYHTIIVSTLC